MATITLHSRWDCNTIVLQDRDANKSFGCAKFMETMQATSDHMKLLRWLINAKIYARSLGLCGHSQDDGQGGEGIIRPAASM